MGYHVFDQRNPLMLTRLAGRELFQSQLVLLKLQQAVRQLSTLVEPSLAG